MPGRELLEANRDRCPQLNHIPIPVSEANLIWGTSRHSSCSAAVLRLSSRSLRGLVIGSWHHRIVVAQRREELIPLAVPIAVRNAVGGSGPYTLRQIEDLFNSHEFTAGLEEGGGVSGPSAPTPPLGVEADAVGNA